MGDAKLCVSTGHYLKPKIEFHECSGFMIMDYFRSFFQPFSDEKMELVKSGKTDEAPFSMLVMRPFDSIF